MKSSIVQWIIASSLVVILFLSIALFMDKAALPFYTRHNEEVEVPEVVEMNYVVADSLLQTKGFRLVVEREQYDWNYPEGTVINQNPEAYAVTKPGRRIYVTTSIGEKLSTMPNLVGKSSRDAIFVLQSAGLTLTEEDFGYEYSNYYPENVVMAQSIPPGTNLRKDTPIHISVSLGTLPYEFRIPNVVGQSLDRARKVILTSGLEVGDIEYQLETALLPNTVISQSPDADVKTERGHLVHLIVSVLTELEEDEEEQAEDYEPEPD